MEKPTPKAELVVVHPGNSGAIVYIYVASADAYAWVTKEAPAFGNLFEPGEPDNHFTLFVTPLYDENEVVAYLSSYSTKSEAD